ncbi:MAG TPA: P-II family nitrogen regulator [Clostridium sp.]
MKEIIAIIRMNMVSKTKDVLLKEGFPSITCKKVMGRGKKKVAYELFNHVTTGEVITPVMAEQLSEQHRLIPKRMIIIIVDDTDVSKVTKIIIKANKTGNLGDGKIFVSTVDDAIRVRTGEIGIEAI